MPVHGLLNSSWPMFHHDLNHTGLSNATAPDSNHLLWASPTGFWLESSPAVSDGKVFIGSEDGKMYCFDASTGAEIWTFLTSQPFVCSPAVSEGKVYIGSGNKHVYCLDASTGGLLWDFPTGWIIAQSSPAVYHGKVYIGSHDYNLYCLDAQNGTELWYFPADYFISSSPAVVDDLVYFGSMGGTLYCLNANSGEQIWDNAIVYTIWTSSPTIYGGRLYIGALDFKLHCFDIKTGHELWNFTTGDYVTGTAAVYDGKIYIGSWDNNLYCLNATTGTVVWQYSTGGPVSDSTAIASGNVYFGSSDTKMYCLDAETGDEIWQYATGGQILSSPAIAEGNLYVGSMDDNVYCFGGGNQPPLADFTWTPLDPRPGQTIVFDASGSSDPDGYITKYEWDWDNDGVYEESSSTPNITHSWSYPGAYPVTLRVTDNDGAQGSLTKTIIIKNQPPDPPVVQGPTSGKKGQPYTYAFNATDPEGDTIYYYIDWGDNTTSGGWLGPYASGVAILQSHTWSKTGTYTIKAKARDIYGNESGWGSLKVTMPLSYEPPHLRFFEWLFERFPHLFPILRRLMGQ
jgi:outer membrane protein assembly factor BamB